MVNEGPVDRGGRGTDQDRPQPKVAGSVKLTRPIARPKVKAMKNKKSKKPLLADAMQEDLSSEPRRQIEHLELKKIDREAWPQFEANRENVVKAGLWDFVTVVFEEQDDRRINQFLTSSEYGSRGMVVVDSRSVPFNLTTISKMLKLHQGDRLLMEEVGGISEDDLTNIFDKAAKTQTGYKLVNAKETWKEWLLFFNQRIMLAEKGPLIMSKEGVAATIYGWNGVKLS